MGRWAAQMSGVAHGLRIGLRATSAQALCEARLCLPPGWTDQPWGPVDRLYSWVVERAGVQVVHADRTRVIRAVDQARILAAIESDLAHYLASQADDFVFIHAGVVGWNGRAVLLPGRSHAGKSTLVAALLRAGATLYSDEYALLDSDGRVHPFARRLTLRRPGIAPARVSAAELGAELGSGALEIGLVGVVRYEPGATFAPRLLSPSEAALALVSHAVSIRRIHGWALPVISRAVQSARALQSSRGEAAEAAAALLAFA